MRRMQKWDLSDAFCDGRGAAPLLVGEELVAAASLSKQSAEGALSTIRQDVAAIVGWEHERGRRPPVRG